MTVSGAPARRAHVLDPVERVSELIFGIVIALSVTGTLSVAAAGRGDVRTMLVAALGANASWGIIDAVMYLVTDLLNRDRARLQLLAVRRCADPEAARQLLADGLLASVASHLRPEDLERARLGILSVTTDPPRPNVTHRELIGAFSVFLLDFLAILPVALPFAIIRDPGLALRTSNGVAMATLFLAGHRLGKVGGFVPWRTGLVMLAVGGILVLVTRMLGG